MAEARRAVDALGLSLEWTELPWGSAYWHEHGRMMPEDALDVVAAHDAVLMGAVGDPSVPGPRLALGARAASAPAARPVGEHPPGAAARRGSRARSRARARRRGHAVHPREHRGRVLGHRRAGAPGLTVGGRRSSRACSRGRAWSGRSASRSSRPRRGAGSSPARPSRTPPATATCSGTRSRARWPPSTRASATSGCSSTRSRRAWCAPGSLDVIVASNLFGDILTDLAAAIQGGMETRPGGRCNVVCCT